jgi:hypothetical protein
MRALVIGINDYPGHDADLAGCVNDANDIAAMLRARGCEPVMLLDRQATKQAIVTEMISLVTSLTAEQVGFISFSGHGTWVPDRDGDELDRRDEALVPADVVDESGLILDDQVDSILGLNRKSRLVLVTDSCHSGTVQRLFGTPGQRRRRRFLSPAYFLDEVSLSRAQALQSAGLGRKPARRQPRPNVIHYGACSDRETAADAVFDGRANGAFTYYFLRALQATNPTYKQVHVSVREHLPNWDFDQTPQLQGAAKEVRRVFLT